MKYIVCDSLLRKYTWKGTRKKPGFVNLTRICRTLYSSVSKCFRKYTQNKFNTYMGEYIKQARTRYVRKLARQNVENDNADDDDSEEGAESEESEVEDEDEDDYGDDDGDEDED